MQHFLLLLVLIVAISIHNTLAHSPLIQATRQRHLDGDSEEEETSTDPVIVRECEIEADSNEIEFACKAEIEEGENELEDEVDYKIATDYQGLHVDVEYKQEVETNDLEQETETSFQVTFDRIVEYAKVSSEDTNQAFDWEKDTVVKTLFLLEWNDFTEIQTDETGVVSHFSVSTLQQVATFNFTISRADYNEQVTANKIKIDVLLSDLSSWKERDDTFVALMSKVESQQTVELDYDDGNHSEESVMPTNAIISFQEATTGTSSMLGLVPFGEFTWAPTAEARTESPSVVNGTVVTTERVANTTSTTSTPIQVVATSPPIVGERLPGDKSSEHISFSFVGDGARTASQIYWDPEAGVGYGEDDGSSSFSGAATRTLRGVGSFSSIATTGMAVCALFLMLV